MASCLADILAEGCLPQLSDNEFKALIAEVLCRLLTAPAMHLQPSCFRRLDGQPDSETGKDLLTGYILIEAAPGEAPVETYYAIGGRLLDPGEFKPSDCCN
jgi:hypothetical protein